MMTNRERLLAIMQGRSPDQIPWIPRLEIWYTAHRLAGTLPERFKNMRLREIQHELGVGAPARTGRVFTTRCHNMDIIERREGLFTTYEYHTPFGMISETAQRTEDLDRAGIYPLIVQKFLKRPEDYDAMMYVIENTGYYPCYEEYEAYDREIGDDGLPMVSIGDVPFHHFLSELAGYEKAYLDLFDDAQKVERLLDTMTDVYRERMWPVVADSPAQLILHGLHFSTQTTPANYYSEYITPYVKEFTDYMHARGKIVTQHADNDSSDILVQLKESGYDMQECFVTAPMVPCTLEQARKAWGDQMIIWGGVPSAILEESFPDEEFEKYMDGMFKAVSPGNAFILGVADNVMTTSLISRIERITELVEERGKLPVSAG